jgi:hypothetical protein
MAGDKDIFLLAQLDPGCDDPHADDLYDVGVVATVLQLLKLPDGTVRVLVEGTRRARMVALTEEDEMLRAELAPVESEAEGPEVAAMMRSVVDQFGEYAKLNKKLRRMRAISFPRSRMPRLWPIRSPAISAPRWPTSRPAVGNRSVEAAGNGLWLHGRRTGRFAGGAPYPWPRQAPDGKDPARILPQRTVEGDPERVGRRR